MTNTPTNEPSEAKPSQSSAADRLSRPFTFTYWHGTRIDKVSDILKHGLVPGEDGYLYVSLRQDFAELYGDVLIRVRTPRELERNPFSKTINAEYRSTTPIPPEFLSYTLTSQAISTLFTTELATIRSEIEAGANIVPLYCGHDAEECHCNRSYIVPLTAIQSIFERHGVK